MSEVYDESSEAQLIEPTFVIDHPREISPLARAHRDDPALVERFELVVAGRELANAYSELNDPVDQAGRFQAEAEQQAGGEEEAEPVDDDYVEALEYGLPPTGGLGIGIDRLVMLIAGQEAIREVILFPTLRPEGAGAGRRPGGRRHRARAVGRRCRCRRGRRAARRSRVGGEPAVAAPTRRPRSLRPLAWASVIVAVFSLLPTVTGSRFSIARFGFVYARGPVGRSDRVGRDRDLADRDRPGPGSRQTARVGAQHRAVRGRRRRPSAARARSARGPAVGGDADRVDLVPARLPRAIGSRLAGAGDRVRAAVPARGARRSPRSRCSPSATTSTPD